MNWIDSLAFALLCVVVLTGAVTDVRTHKVPNRLTYPAMLGGVLYWTLIGLMQNGMDGAAGGMWAASTGLAAGLIPFAILFAIGGIGGGDAKLMGAVGALGGAWQLAFDAALIAFIVVLMMALIVMIRRRLVKVTASRMINALFSVMTKTTVDFPTDSPRIPFAVAIAVGSIIAGLRYLLHLPVPYIGIN